MHPDIESLIKELIALGEDREELVFWKTIYKDLTSSEQQELQNILIKELKTLRNQNENH